jgi:hypothetical protein
MKVFLLLYTVFPMSAGLVEMTGMPTPESTGVGFRFPTEQLCQAAAEAINELGSGPVTNDDAKAVIENGLLYSDRSLLLVANCEIDEPDGVAGKRLVGWQGYEDPKQRKKPIELLIVDALKALE